MPDIAFKSRSTRTHFPLIASSSGVDFGQQTSDKLGGSKHFSIVISVTSDMRFSGFRPTRKYDELTASVMRQ